MTLWSNPTPSGADSATLSSQYRVQAADIGHLVNAILDYRRQQEQQQQKAYSDIAKGVAGAYSGYQQGQNASDANDAANAAIYGSQYPNDPYGGYSNPDVVPDYGGTSALAGIGAERKLNPEAFMSDYQRMLIESKIDSNDALTLQRLRGGSGYDNQLGPQTQTDDQGITWRLGAGNHWYQMKEPRTPNDEPPADFPDAYNSGADPALNISDILDPTKATFRAKDPNHTYYGNRAVSDADVISLAKQYGMDRAATPAPPSTQLAPGYGTKIPDIGTSRSVNGVIYKWDGKGWLPALPTDG